METSLIYFLNSYGKMNDVALYSGNYYFLDSNKDNIVISNFTVLNKSNF